jgi:hypothetical protein
MNADTLDILENIRTRLSALVGLSEGGRYRPYKKDPRKGTPFYTDMSPKDQVRAHRGEIPTQDDVLQNYARVPIQDKPEPSAEWMKKRAELSMGALGSRAPLGRHVNPLTGQPYSRAPQALREPGDRMHGDDFENLPKAVRHKELRKEYGKNWKAYK